MPVLEIAPPPLDSQPITHLSSALAAVGSSLTVENTAGFAYSNIIVVGNPGEEKTEGIALHASTGLTTTVLPTVAGGVDFAHAVGTKITRADYDQIKIYRATTETGTYSLVATIDVDWEKETTRYNDTAGSSTSWYKTLYYHSISAAASDYSDAIGATGYKARSVGAMIEQIRSLTNQKGTENYGDDDIRAKINNSHSELADERNWPFLNTTGTDSTEDGVQAYDLPSNYKHGSITALRITSGTVYYYPDYISHDEFMVLNRVTTLEASKATITHFTIVGTQFYLYPMPNANGTNDITLFFTKRPTTLSDLNDVSDFPEASYFIYDVAEQIAIEQSQDTTRIGWLAGRKAEAKGGLMYSYTAKQTAGPLFIGGSQRKTIDPNFYKQIG